MAEEKIEKRIEAPQGVSASAEKMSVLISGKNGQIKKTFNAKGISFRADGNAVVVEARPATKRMNSLLRTVVSHIENMIFGVQQDYQYKMAVVYSHFPMNIKVKEKTLEINNFTGEKYPRTAKIRGSAKVEVKGKEIIVSGIDKDAVGQTAANIENATRVVGKDRRIYQDGIFIVEKAAAGAKHG